MKFAEISYGELTSAARTRGLKYRVGPFSIHLKSDVLPFLEAFQRAYADVRLLPDNEICHFRLSILRAGGVRGYFRPQVQFTAEGVRPFEPFPLDHAFPLYEWGLNWCIANTAHNYLMLHSAVLEKAGRGVILPATPGSGKSTLCIGLVSRGWRLLSDEFGMVRQTDACLLPMPRAAPLKNESIQVIRDFAPELELGPEFEKTRKGTIAHVFPLTESIGKQAEAATARWIIFPKFQAGATTVLRPQAASQTFVRLINNSFNYQVTMESGFHSMIDLVRQTDSFELPNGNLEQAVDAIENLLAADLT